VIVETRSVLDDGRTVHVEGDGTVTVYSPDRRRYLIVQVHPDLACEAVGLFDEDAPAGDGPGRQVAVLPAGSLSGPGPGGRAREGQR
jgi:hypothetical protein